MITKKITLSIMFGLLIIPVATWIFKIGKVCSIDENRNRLEFPSQEEISEEGFTAINKWFNDNFGMRDLLIRLQHQIDYSLFKYSDSIYCVDVDDKEYLLYRSVIDGEQIINENISDERMTEIITSIENVEQFLNNEGISFKFIVPPQKNEILDVDEQIPVHRPEFTAYDRFERDVLNSSLADNYVPIRDSLKEANDTAPVFYKTDFHWNDYGAAIAMGTVINDYSNGIDLGNVYDFDALEQKPMYLSLNQAQLSNLSPLYYHLEEENTANVLLDQYSDYTSYEENENIVVWSNPGDAEFDGSVLFIGDSYTPPALYAFNDTHSGIVELFPRVYFCHWDYSEGILKNIPEDVELVVVERIESALSYIDDNFNSLLSPNYSP